MEQDNLNFDEDDNLNFDEDDNLNFDEEDNNLYWEVTGYNNKSLELLIPIVKPDFFFKLFYQEFLKGYDDYDTMVGDRSDEWYNLLFLNKNLKDIINDERFKIFDGVGYHFHSCNKFNLVKKERDIAEQEQTRDIGEMMYEQALYKFDLDKMMKLIQLTTPEYPIYHYKIYPHCKHPTVDIQEELVKLQNPVYTLLCKKKSNNILKKLPSELYRLLNSFI